MDVIMTEENRLKTRVQRNVLIGSSLILVAKFAAYFMTNSVGILTDAMESIVNVLAGAISLLCLYLAARPKDDSHPFGHGKIELISSSVEGAMIVVAGVLIIYEGIKRLLSPGELQKIDVGIYIIAISGALNYLMGWYSVKTGKKHNSMALVAEGRHLQSDTYSTIGLLIGLGLLYFTEITWIDSAMALVFGALIIMTGISILRKSTDNLLDRADMALLSDMAATLDSSRKPEWIDIHNAKVAKYGSSLHIDCDLTLPWFYTIEQGHRTGDELLKVLENKYSDNVNLNVHFDPCNIFESPKCRKCQYPGCGFRKEPFAEADPITADTFVKNEKEHS